MLIKSIPSSQQRRALDTGVSVWLSANAGTGKTEVLTGRMIRLMLEGVAPERILALTFTNAAAAEMADRIRREIARWAMLDDAALKETLEKRYEKKATPEAIARARALFALVVDRPGNVRIQTIHGFCQRLLGGFCLEAGLSPGFTVMEEAATEECRRDAFHEMLGRRDLSPSAEQGLGVIACLAGDKGLKELLEAIQQQRQLFGIALADGVNAAIARLAQALDIDPALTKENIIARIAGRDLSHLAPAAELLEKSDTSDATKQRVTRQFSAWLAASQATRITTLETYWEVFFTDSGEGKTRDNLFLAAMRKQHPETVETFAEEQRYLQAEREQLRALEAYARMAALLPVAAAFLAQYEERKKRLNALDFDDLIARSLALLKTGDIAPWIRYKLDGGVEHILVDEAQDTNAAQWNIIEALCEEFFVGQGASQAERTLFVVGDPKQSIFSFQGANPREYARMETMLQSRAAAAQKRWQPEQLDTSYRSTASVLRLVDAVCNAMGKAMEAAHAVHRTQAAGRVELWPIVKPVKPEEEKFDGWKLPTEAAQKDDPQKKIVDAIIGTIRHWLRDQRLLESKGRPVEPGDILILVRRRSRLMQRLVHGLKKAGIAVAGVDRLKLLDHIIVQDLVQLGRFLLLPEDDLSLAIILKSPFIGLGEEQLFTLAHDRGEASLWQRLKASDDAQCKAAYARLAEFLGLADFMPPYQLFSTILEARGGREQAAARMGEGVQDILNVFLNQVLNFEQLHPPSLQGFLDWLEEQGTEIKRNPELSGNQVRIMTVHGAKGLQAPIVFIPDAACPAKRNARQQLYWDEEYALPFWPLGALPAYGDRLKQQKKQSETEEENRLLYVALTRAADELYIGGWTSGEKGGESQTGWYRLIETAMQGEKCPAPAIIGGEALCFSNIQREKAVPDLRHAAIAETAPLPLHLHKAPPLEMPQRAIAITAHAAGKTEYTATTADEIEIATARGIWLHRLLELLPAIAEEVRRERAHRYLASQASALPLPIREEIANEAVGILAAPELRPYFDPATSIAEVPVVGRVENVEVTGRIDRLCILPKEIVIIDYKTARQVPAGADAVPEAYRRQMAYYEAVLAPLYPGKTIRSALLYTGAARLVWLS